MLLLLEVEGRLAIGEIVGLAATIHHGRGQLMVLIGDAEQRTVGQTKRRAQLVVGRHEPLLLQLHLLLLFHQDGGSVGVVIVVWRKHRVEFCLARMVRRTVRAAADSIDDAVHRLEAVHGAGAVGGRGAVGRGCAPMRSLDDARAAVRCLALRVALSGAAGWLVVDGSSGATGSLDRVGLFVFAARHATRVNGGGNQTEEGYHEQRERQHGYREAALILQEGAGCTSQTDDKLGAAKGLVALGAQSYPELFGLWLHVEVRLGALVPQRNQRVEAPLSGGGRRQ